MSKKAELHYDGKSYQIREENHLGSRETFAYQVVNGLPSLINIQDIQHILKIGNITYQESQRSYANDQNILDFIIVNKKVVKIDYKSNKRTLSCDLNDGHWNCLCSL